MTGVHLSMENGVVSIVKKGKKRTLPDGPANNLWNPEVESNDPTHSNAVPVRI